MRLMRVSQWFQQLLRRAHREQSGAVMLLCLAAVLILFMLSLVVYDAGQGVQDKIDVQIGADSAAFSHTVVKARAMNTIAYANTIKRMLFSYLATYVNGMVAILIMWAWHAARCFKVFPNFSSCAQFFGALPMVIAEIVELFSTNAPTLGIPFIGGSSSSRSRVELVALENYQRYMFSIAPWWAYGEGVLHGTRNGAMLTAAWPVPDPSLAGASHIDTLPISRRDKDNAWASVSAPWNNWGASNSSGHGWSDHLDYCFDVGNHGADAYFLSMESIVTGLQTLLASDDKPRGWKVLFIILHGTGSLGCLVAGYSYRDDSYLDWRIHPKFQGNQQRWLQGSSSLHVAYNPRAGRNSDSGERQKFGFIHHEPTFSDDFKNEGYFAAARSELVYKQAFGFLNSGHSFIDRLTGGLNILGFNVGNILNRRAGAEYDPNMWSPRWKARNRPIMLPGETFGSPIGSSNMATAMEDVAPYLRLALYNGLTSDGNPPPWSAASAENDFNYLIRAGQGFSNSAIMQGIGK